MCVYFCFFPNNSNVRLVPEDHSPAADAALTCFTYIPGLRHLSVVHCGLESLHSLKGQSLYTNCEKVHVKINVKYTCTCTCSGSCMHLNTWNAASCEICICTYYVETCTTFTCVYSYINKIYVSYCFIFCFSFQ